MNLYKKKKILSQKYDDKYEEIILLVKNLGLGLGVSLEEKI